MSFGRWVLVVAALICGCGGSGGPGAGAPDAGDGATNDARAPDDLAGGDDGAGGQEHGAGGADGAPSERGAADATLEGAATAPPIGDSCNFNSFTTVDANPDSGCESGYCLWDGRTIGESYCSRKCAGLADASCPTGYACVADTFKQGNFWCGRQRQITTDLGTTCTRGLGSCELSFSHEDQSYCISPADTCAEDRCLHDPTDQKDLCTGHCNPTRLPCPAGYDCRKSPLFADGYVCSPHHEPSVYLGLLCSPSTPLCTTMPCPTKENQRSCAPTGGYCVQAQTPYCTYRCETTACSAGYTCTMITSDPAGVPSGMYCLKNP